MNAWLSEVCQVGGMGGRADTRISGSALEESARRSLQSWTLPKLACAKSGSVLEDSASKRAVMIKWAPALPAVVDEAHPSTVATSSPTAACSGLDDLVLTGVPLPTSPDLPVAGVASPTSPKLLVVGVAPPASPDLPVTGVALPTPPGLAFEGVSWPTLPGPPEACVELPTSGVPSPTPPGLPVTEVPSPTPPGLPVTEVPSPPSASASSRSVMELD